MAATEPVPKPDQQPELVPAPVPEAEDGTQLEPSSEPPVTVTSEPVPVPEPTSSPSPNSTPEPSVAVFDLEDAGKSYVAEGPIGNGGKKKGKCNRARR